MSKPTRQARYWICTKRFRDEHGFPGELVEPIRYIEGQLEQGEQTSYKHWQFILYAKYPISRRWIKLNYGNDVHAEPSRSSAVEQYVRKERTRIGDSHFVMGSLPVKRNCQKDWDDIYNKAKEDKLDEIPADIRVTHYKSLKQIAKDNLKPAGFIKRVVVYWGRTGTGKSHRAWRDAGIDAYPKSPTSIYWDGYRGEDTVVIDEFRGGIGISHVLRWFDKYPVIIEVKFGATTLKATKIFITSNLSPNDWYENLDDETLCALLRRLEVHHITGPLDLHIE